MNIKIPALVRVHVATILFGIAGLFAVSTGLGSLTITFGRTLFAACALILFVALVRRGERLVPDLQTIVSGMLLALHWTLFFKSIQVSSVAVGLIMFAVSATFIAVLEPLYFREPFRRGDLLAATAVVVGIAVLVGGDTAREQVWLGVLWGSASSLAFAVLQLMNRSLTRSREAVAVALIQNIVAFVVLLPFVSATLSSISFGQWGQLMFLGVFCTALAHTLFISALKTTNAALAGLISGGLEPVYGALLAALLLAQYPQMNVLAGGAIIVIAVAWASYRKVDPT